MYRKNHTKIYQLISSFHLKIYLNLTRKDISSGKIRNSGNYIYDYAHSFFVLHPSRYAGIVCDQQTRWSPLLQPKWFDTFQQAYKHVEIMEDILFTFLPKWANGDLHLLYCEEWKRVVFYVATGIVQRHDVSILYSVIVTSSHNIIMKDTSWSYILL